MPSWGSCCRMRYRPYFSQEEGGWDGQAEEAAGGCPHRVWASDPPTQVHTDLLRDVRQGINFLFYFQGYRFWSPFWKWYFFLLLRHIIFRLPSCPSCLINSSLICIYFTLLLPLFFLFLLHFPPFYLPLFIFFPPNDIGWYFPSPLGAGGYFPIYRPLFMFWFCNWIYCNYSIGWAFSFLVWLREYWRGSHGGGLLQNGNDCS